MPSTTTITKNEDAASQQLQGLDIAKVLRSEGPIVTCVVLRAESSNNGKDDDSKPSSSADNDATNTIIKNLKTHLVDEIKMDTTPKKNEVETILGGPFSFIGQYEEEGIMLMARRGWVFDGDDEETSDDPKFIRNTHALQPPFDTARVYGDILVLKVAEVDDPLDNTDHSNEEADAADGDAPAATLEVVSNDDFFLDYTKVSYMTFAARTDVVPPVLPEADEEEEQEDGVSNEQEDAEAAQWSGDEQEDSDDDDEEEEPTEEEEKGAMMQLVLSTVMKQFQEKNGRAPSEEEQMVLRLTVAHKLGMVMPGMEGEDDDDDDEEEESEEVEQEGSSNDEEAASPATSEGSDFVDQEKKRTSDAHDDEDGKPMAKKVKLDMETAEASKEAVQ